MANRIRDWTRVIGPRLHTFLERSSTWLASLALVLSLTAMTIGIYANGKANAETAHRVNDQCVQVVTLKSKFRSMADFLEQNARDEGRTVTPAAHQFIDSIRHLGDNPLDCK